jgi:hypothetical protein
MREYRIFLLRDGRIAKPSVSHTCASDLEAINKAEQVANGLDFEIWDGPRIIIRGDQPNRA